jgi:hypothetical protein
MNMRIEVESGSECMQPGYNSRCNLKLLLKEFLNDPNRFIHKRFQHFTVPQKNVPQAFVYGEHHVTMVYLQHIFHDESAPLFRFSNGTRGAKPSFAAIRDQSQIMAAFTY